MKLYDKSKAGRAVHNSNSTLRSLAVVAAVVGAVVAAVAGGVDDMIRKIMMWTIIISFLTASWKRAC